jgi:transcriptional regulator with XRE-family HTH domain
MDIDLKALRQSLDCTVVQMADLMGMSTRAYHNIEQGHSTLKSQHQAQALMVALDVALARRDPSLIPAPLRDRVKALADLLV